MSSLIPVQRNPTSVPVVAPTVTPVGPPPATPGGFDLEVQIRKADDDFIKAVDMKDNRTAREAQIRATELRFMKAVETGDAVAAQKHDRDLRDMKEGPTHLTRAIKAKESEIAGLTGPDAEARKIGLQARLSQLTKAEQDYLSKSSPGGRAFSAQREKYRENIPIGQGEAALAKGFHGLSLGWLDELRGLEQAGEGNVLKGAVRYATGAPGSEQAYERGKFEEAERGRRAQVQWPKTSIAAEFAGGALVPGAGFVRGATPLARMGTTAATGGVIGGLYGAGASEEQGVGRLSDLGFGTMLGAPLGAAGEAILGGASRAGRSAFAGAPMPPPNTAAGATAAANAQAARTIPLASAGGTRHTTDFGVPLTRGQATGDVAQQGVEEGLRAGQYGFGQQARQEAFDATQAAAIERAKEQISRGLGGAPRTTEEAADVVAGGLKARAADLEAQADAAYGQARDKRAFVPTDVIGQLNERIQKDLGAKGIYLDPLNHPATTMALNVLGRLPGFSGAVSSFGPDAGATITRQALKGVEEARKSAFRIVPQNDNDRRALTNMRRSFDGWLNDAIDNKLFTGDKTALDDLKQGRELWSRYASIANGDKNDAQKIIAKITTEEMSGDKVANFLLNTSGAGMTDRSAKIAREIKGHLGADSEAYEALRQGILSKVLNPKAEKGLESGNQAIATAIQKFTDGEGRALARQLMTPDEISDLRRLGNVLRTVQGSPLAKNPSGSGHTMIRWLAQNGIGGSSAIGSAYVAYNSNDPLVRSAALAGVAAPLMRRASTITRGAAARRATPSPVGPAAATVGSQAVGTAAGQAGGQLADDIPLLRRGPQ